MEKANPGGEGQKFQLGPDARSDDESGDEMRKAERVGTDAQSRWQVHTSIVSYPEMDDENGDESDHQIIRW